MKALYILFSLTLAGCQTVPAKQEFPKPPSILMQPAEPLIKLDR